MAFEIKKNLLQGIETIEILNPQTKASISISTTGAILNSWKVPIHGQFFELIAGNDFSNGFQGFEQKGFKSGKMSPFSCRLSNGQYMHDGKEYKINKFYLDKHAIHGIIYDAVYDIDSIKSEDNQAIITLTHAYVGTDPGYPFYYTITIQYTFTIDNLIQVSTTIENKSTTTIPVMDGWHPYFQLDEPVNELKLSFENVGKLEFDQELIPTGKFIMDNSFELGKKINSIHMDDCYRLKPNTSILLQGEQVQLTITPKINYPFLQIYTPENRKNIAIENLSGAPDCFNNKIGLQLLKPNTQISFVTEFLVNECKL